MEQYETFILIISTMLCHVVLNIQETKYGTQTSANILREFMKHGFERMCIFYERLGAKVCFYLHYHMYVCVCVEIPITIYFYVFRWKMKGQDIKKQVDHQENIMLKNQSTISPTDDEEMRHAHSFNNVKSSTDE